MPDRRDLCFCPLGVARTADQTTSQYGVEQSLDVWISHEAAHGLVSQYYWVDLDEVRDFAAKWSWFYNNERSNMALGGFTPKQRQATAAQLYL
eukprot:gene3205-3248_t